MKRIFLAVLVSVSAAAKADPCVKRPTEISEEDLYIEREEKAHDLLVAAAFAPPGSTREDIERMASETFPAMAKILKTPLKSPYCQWVLASWRKGEHAKVLKEGERRLAKDKDDLVGLLIKASWALCYSDPVAVSNALVKVDREIRKVQTPTFRGMALLTQGEIRKTLSINGKMTKKEYEADQRKSRKPMQHFDYEIEMRALDIDGYFKKDVPPEAFDPSEAEVLNRLFGFLR